METKTYIPTHVVTVVTVVTVMTIVTIVTVVTVLTIVTNKLFFTQKKTTSLLKNFISKNIIYNNKKLFYKKLPKTPL